MKETHEIVKVNILEETLFKRPETQDSYQEVEHLSSNGVSPIRIQVADVTLEILESVDTIFLSRVLQAVRYPL